MEKIFPPTNLDTFASITIDYSQRVVPDNLTGLNVELRALSRELKNLIALADQLGVHLCADPNNDQLEYEALVREFFALIRRMLSVLTLQEIIHQDT